MVARNTLKYFSAFVDGVGYAGEVLEYTAPTLAVASEEHRAGGMDAPIDVDMGMEKMVAALVLGNYAPQVLKLQALKSTATLPFTVRGSLENRGGATKPVIHKMRGKIMSADPGTWGSGQKPSLTLNLSLTYFAQIIDGSTIVELDPVNMVRIVDGVDQLAEHRANIGF